MIRRQTKLALPAAAVAALVLSLGACDGVLIPPDPEAEAGFDVDGLASAMSKVDVCHVDEDGAYRLITIAEAAYVTHLGHGDASPGDAVPGMPGQVFGPDCEPEAYALSGYGIVTSGDVLNYGDGGWAGWSVPSGVVLGGGFRLTGGPAAVSAPGTPGSAWPHYTFGAGEYGWVVRDAQDGAGSPGSAVYAVFAGEPMGYEIVTSSALAFGDGGYGGWSCPAGKVALGGGFEATGPVAVSAPGTPGSA
ncbi:MAG: hypothetical protein GWN71_02715, partial [Gammaproteobacteria bacterium]|nr:hypothetical protein [Gemmatimonadota bacterium]NIR34901.1 hypothetical protein [Actinomycetota bacterium]NIU72520.1 hypothetical protein [Gammaproteobacteria bacterium]NIY07132.1 hypothetical protein [Gemmatimonadota bacterium]